MSTQEKQINKESGDLQILYSKLGKNIVMFQKVEGLLKYLISRSHVESLSDTHELNIEKSLKKVSGQTLGNLCNQFIDSVFEEKFQDKSSSFTFSFHIDVPKEFIEKREKNLKKINSERNSLVHEIYENYDLSCIESRTKLEKKLCALETLLDSEFKMLKTLVEKVILSSKEFLENVKNQH